MTKYRMSDSDNAQLPIYTPQEEEKETPQKKKKKQKQQWYLLKLTPQENLKSPKNTKHEIAISLEPTEYVVINNP